MATREYIGARYVPLICGTWDSTLTYEPLSVVLYEGNSYTSRMYVPAGIDITNEDYWAETGNYDAQVEAYRTEVTNYTASVAALQEQVETNTSDIAEIVENFEYNVQNSLMMSAAVPEENFTTLGTLAVKSNHYIQGGWVDYTNGYIYEAEIISGNTSAYLRKFSLETLELIDELSLGDGLHCNGVSPAPNNQIMVSSSGNYVLSLVDADTMTLNATTSLSSTVSTACFNEDFTTLVLATPSGQGIYGLYAPNPLYDGYYSPFAVFKSIYPKRNMLGQDMFVASNYLFQLLSSYIDAPDTYHSCIRIYNLNYGTLCGDIYLPNLNNEYENVTVDLDNNIIYLIDSSGVVYKVDFDGYFMNSYSGNSVNQNNLELTQYLNHGTGVMTSVTVDDKTFHVLTEVPLCLNSSVSNWDYGLRILPYLTNIEYNIFGEAFTGAIPSESSETISIYGCYISTTYNINILIHYSLDTSTNIYSLRSIKACGITSSLSTLYSFVTIDNYDSYEEMLTDFFTTIDINPSNTYMYFRANTNNGNSQMFSGYKLYIG